VEKMDFEEKENSLKNIVREVSERTKDVVEQILTPSELDISEIKEEVWQDLSILYYKYEVEEQKRAFREVMYEISEKINEGKWENVYKKLYRIGQKT
jgi:hypothetical protein